MTEIEQLRAELAEVKLCLRAERGDPSAGLPGWEKDPVRNAWYRVIAVSTAMIPPRRQRTFQMLRLSRLPTVVDGKVLEWLYEYVDTSLHVGEESPHEIAEWTGFADGPRECMRAAEAEYVRVIGPLSKTLL